MSWAPIQLTHVQRVTRLYKRSLRHLLSWCIDRQLWREEALELRARFDANKNVTDKKKALQLLEEGEAEFMAKRHPNPIICRYQDDRPTRLSDKGGVYLKLLFSPIGQCPKLGPLFHFPAVPPPPPPNWKRKSKDKQSSKNTYNNNNNNIYSTEGLSNNTQAPRNEA